VTVLAKGRQVYRIDRKRIIFPAIAFDRFPLPAIARPKARLALRIALLRFFAAAAPQSLHGFIEFTHSNPRGRQKYWPVICGGLRVVSFSPYKPNIVFAAVLP
jgi:hypothetical protein